MKHSIHIDRMLSELLPDSTGSDPGGDEAEDVSSKVSEENDRESLQ